MEIRAMDLIDKEDQNKRIKIVTRFLIEPNEPERTYIYGPGNAFEIKEDHVSGVMVYAADDALRPTLKKGCDFWSTRPLRPMTVMIIMFSSAERKRQKTLPSWFAMTMVASHTLPMCRVCNGYRI